MRVTHLAATLVLRAVWGVMLLLGRMLLALAIVTEARPALTGRHSSDWSRGAAGELVAKLTAQSNLNRARLITARRE